MRPQLEPNDDWIFHLGALLSSFHSLEFIVRAFLSARTAPPAQRPPYGESLYDAPPGTLVLLNPMMDYRTLLQILRAYNASLPKGRTSWMVDEGVVAIRDAFAHGRVAAPADDPTMHLIKFARPSTKNATHVHVVDNIAVDLSWLKAKISHVLEQVSKVAEAHESLHGGSLTNRRCRLTDGRPKAAARR